MGITFNVNASPSSYAKLTHFDNPLIVSENITNYSINHPFDIVWIFTNPDDINTLTNSFLKTIRRSDMIKDGVIATIDWCLNEVMDNVLQHSEVEQGYIMGQIHPSQKKLSFCIFDTGIGIYNSLNQSKTHHPSTPLDAITLAMNERVTRDNNVGQGNGLWGFSNIISQANGMFSISSNGAKYTNSNGKETTIKSGYFNLGHDRGTTLIDFQLNYSENIDVVAALNGHKVTDLWLENLENENDDNIVEIKISEMADGTGTRKSALALRNLLLNIVNCNKKFITLDFVGVNIVSSSFADELIGKIIRDHGFVFFIQTFKLKNLNKTVANIINRSVEQRMAQMYYDVTMSLD